MSGGLDITSNDKFGRDSYKADIAYFLSGFGGDHEFKVGGDYEKITVDAYPLPLRRPAHLQGLPLRPLDVRRRGQLDGLRPRVDLLLPSRVLHDAVPPGGAYDPNMATLRQGAAGHRLQGRRTTPSSSRTPGASPRT